MKRDPAAAVDEQTINKAVAAAAIGNATEWFDFGVYAYLVSIIGRQFFPASDPTAETLYAFVAFAGSFLIRPFGGMIFGPLGDKLGRKRILALTLFLMAGSTFAIGVLPTYAQVGVLAPILLVLARLLQGFSTGGEYGGAATFIAEYAPDHKRGKLCSFLELGSLCGFALAILMVGGLTLALSEAQMDRFGWRLPFLLSAPLGLVGLYLRNRLGETPVFEEMAETAQAEGPSRLRETLVEHWPRLLMCAGIVIILNVANYTFLTYTETYLLEVLGRGKVESLFILAGVIGAMMLFVVPVGALSDRIGRKPILLTGAIGFVTLSYPAYALVGAGGPATWLGLGVLGALLVLLLGTIPSALPALFETRIRYSGFAISYNVSTSLFGGTAPAVITWLIHQTGNPSMPAFYLMGAALIAIVPILVSPETAGKPLPGTARALGASSHEPVRPRLRRAATGT